MDSPEVVLLKAATLIGSAALDEVSKRAVGDAWEALKAAIRRRLGADHPAPAVFDHVRNAAGNEIEMARQQAQLARLHLGHDPEVLRALEQLAVVVRQHSQELRVSATLVQGAMIVNGSQTNNFN